jgi:hypothetical protein
MRLDIPDMSVSSPEEEDLVPGITGNIFNLTAYPNPFSQQLNIEFSLSENTPVRIIIYNILGEQIYYENYNELSPGRHTLEILPKTEQSGYYFYSIITSKGKISGKVLKE